MFHFPPFSIRMCVCKNIHIHICVCGCSVVCQRISIPPKTFASLLAPCFWFYRHRLQHFGEQAAETCLYSQPDGPMYCQTGALSKHLCTPHLKMFFGGGMWRVSKRVLISQNWKLFDMWLCDWQCGIAFLSTTIEWKIVVQ